MDAGPSHFLLSASADPDGCVLDRFPSIRDTLWQPTEGVPVGPVPGGKLGLPMSRRMGGRAVGDFVANTLGLLVASERAASFLRAHATAPVEYVPLSIVDHKGRRLPAPLWIVNVLGSVACVDLGASAYEKSALRSGEFFSVKRLALDPKRTDPTRNLFRVPEMPSLVIVTAELGAAMREAGVSGFDLIDPSGPLEI